MAMGVKIFSTDGSPMTFWKAIAKYFGYFISGPCLGFLWIIWDEQKQGWHDKIAGTYVIRA